MPLKGRASHHRQSRKTTSTTKGGGSVSRQGTTYVPSPAGGGTMMQVPATITETTPSTTTTEEQQSSGERAGSFATAGGHAHGGVLLWSLLLLAFATWDGFSKPMLDKVWNGTAATTKVSIDGRLVLGGIVFCVIIAMLANSSPAMGSIITVMVIGLWVIFLTQNGISLSKGQKVPSGVIVDFFNWFSAHSQTTTTQSGVKS